MTSVTRVPTVSVSANVAPVPIYCVHMVRLDADGTTGALPGGSVEVQVHTAIMAAHKWMVAAYRSSVFRLQTVKRVVRLSTHAGELERLRLVRRVVLRWNQAVPNGCEVSIPPLRLLLRVLVRGAAQLWVDGNVVGDSDVEPSRDLVE